MTAPELVAALIEEPSGTPWLRDWIRDWEPAPLPPLEHSPLDPALLATPVRRWWR